MRKTTAYLLLLSFSIALLWYFHYPEHLGAVEAYSFFAWLPDYFLLHPIYPGKLSEIIGDFLSQFYRWREIGALIQTFFFMIVWWGTDRILSKISSNKQFWTTLFPACILLFLQIRWGIELVHSLYYLFFVILLALYPAAKNKWINIIYCIFVIAFSISVLSTGTTVLFYISLILLLALSYWKQQTTSLLNKFVVGRKIQIFLSLVIIFTTIGLFLTDEKANKKEKQYAVENAAFVSDWNKILSIISPEDAKKDSLLLRYSLLALSEENIMPESLASLLPLTPDCFYFHRTSEPSTQYFNSLFYAGLGIYNESIHQITEATTVTNNGINFRSLRSMIDWYLKMGNIALVKKYMIILGQSTCHDRWIQQRKKLLHIIEEKAELTPDKSQNDLFIGAHNFIVEMDLLVKEEPDNKKRTDYLLCAWLLNGYHQKFKEVLELSIYKTTNQTRPQLYQQFLLMEAF